MTEVGKIEFAGDYGSLCKEEDHLRIIADLMDGIERAEEMCEMLANVLHQCHEAMGYMSEYDIPIALPDHVKEALEKYEAFKK